MKPADRYNWLVDYIAEERAPVDVLNRDFVDAYIEATGASFKAVMYGAHKCPQLGRDLSHLAEVRRLRRYRTGLGDMGSGMGFPRWVWSYRL